MSNKFYAIVAGVGAGTGRSVARRFAQKYNVVLLARKQESFQNIVSEIQKEGGQALGIVADVSDRASLQSAVKNIHKELPDQKLAAAVYNVNGGFVAKPFLELESQELDNALDGTVRAFFNFAQETIPLLLDSVETSTHPPTLLITGATASTKGSARFGAFAAGKFALRALGQSLAREFGPRGVHVAHAIIDGVIDIPRYESVEINQGASDGKISPDAIAEAYWQLHTQHRSALTQELDLRPYVEKF